MASQTIQCLGRPYNIHFEPNIRMISDLEKRMNIFGAPNPNDCEETANFLRSQRET
jgi:hypothetical protein